MPTTSGPREVPDSVAGELGDLYAVQHDLKTARSYCERAKREWQDLPSADWDVVHGLSEAAVIRYARYFTSGRRFKLDGSWLPPDLRDLHDAFFELRSRHVAHPVNDFEHGSVTVHVIESGGPREVQKIGMGVARVAGFNPPAADELMKLCDAVLAALKPRMERQRDEVQQHVSSLPVDEVYSWPKPPPFKPSGKQRVQRRTR